MNKEIVVGSLEELCDLMCNNRLPDRNNYSDDQKEEITESRKERSKCNGSPKDL